MRLSSLLVLACMAAAGPLAAQSTILASVDSGGTQGNSNSSLAAISGDGRFTVFLSYATNLVAGDTNGLSDIFVHDGQSGTTTRVSFGIGGAQTNGNNDSPSISADGRYVAFTGYGSNLVVGDTNNNWDSFLLDTQTGTTIRVSVDSGGVQANSNNFNPVVCADGHRVAFSSNATNLVPGDTNSLWEVFVHDTATGATLRACVDSSGNEGDGTADHAAISADGRYVAFTGYATNLVAGDTNNSGDIFVHDFVTGTTVRASVDSAGNEVHGNSDYASLSADGRYVAFTSYAPDLVLGDTNGTGDIFVHDLVTGTTQRVSVTSGGSEANGNSEKPSISADSRFVAFTSYATDLVAGDTNGYGDIFRHDRITGVTTRLSVNSAGNQAHGNCDRASISSNGRFTAFTSFATDLVTGDTNGYGDVFVRDHGLGGFPTFCPGDGSAGACPCGNSGAAGRGCENSGATGGAQLGALGTTSPDTVVLTSSGELPVAPSIFLQGNFALVSPVTFGDGVRCTGGILKRLYVKPAVAGVVTAPVAGDPSITTQSANLGDPIAHGSTRWYQVYYRDPNPSFCPIPTGNTWNVSSGVVIAW